MPGHARQRRLHRRTAWRFAFVPPLLALLFASGCSRESGGNAESVGAEDSVLDGISRQEIREQARPMSPEQAESLGIVDTTTHLEIPPEDTLLPDSAGIRRPADTLP